MKRLLVRLAMTAAVVVPLAACSDSNDMDRTSVTPPPAPPPPPPVSTAFTVESFGAGFASIFRADANSEPRDPGEGDIIPISFTTESSDPIGF